MARRALAGSAPTAITFHVADGCGGTLLARPRRIHRPDRPAHRRRLRPAVARDCRSGRTRSRRPRPQGGRHPRYLDRHQSELAGRWRRPIGSGIVGPSDLRSRPQSCRLSRFWGLPRSRSADAARRVAPLRVFQGPAGAADVFGRHRCGRSCHGPAGRGPGCRARCCVVRYR